MIVVDGKTYYTFAEAAQETGYTIGTIRTYVSKDQIEAEKLQDGFALTELGMKQLRIRKNREENTVKPMEQKPEPEPQPVKPKKKKSHHEPPGTSVKFNTPRGYEVIEQIKIIAEATGQSMKDCTINILYNACRDKSEKLKEIEQLKTKLKELQEAL